MYKNARICIIGPGAIGGVVAGVLVREGFQVQLVTKHEELAIRKARTLFIDIIREAVEVAGAMNLKIAPAAGGKLDYYKFLGPGLLSESKRHLTIRVIGMKYRKLKSSSLQSLERGRKTEVDNYNGYISEKGRAYKVPTPVNDQLTRMVREIENGKREMGPENFNKIT